MWSYLFIDDVTGEQFFVECDTKAEAMILAKKYFSAPKAILKVDPADAGWYDVDTVLAIAPAL